MALPATPIVKINLSGGAVFETPMILGTGQLDYATLQDSVPYIVDISSSVSKISTRKERNLLQDKYLAGTATVRVIDPNGDWNPQNSASPLYPYLQPLRSIQITTVYGGVTYPIFKGNITQYLYTYPKDQEIGYVDLVCSDAFRLLFNSNVTTVTGAIAGQDSGTRINKLLDAIGWPSTSRDIQTGNTTLQADPGTTRTSLAAIETVVFSEQGAFYFDKAGLATFKNRNTCITSAGGTPFEFSNVTGSGKINYFNIKFSHDDKTVVNQITVTRLGGTPQTATDSASIAKYFLHNITAPDMLMETDAEALNVAQEYIATRKDVTIRIDEITLDLVTLGYSAGIVAALDLDYLDPMQITNEGQMGTTLTKTLQCQGIVHDITPNTWFTTFTTQEPITDGFILNSTAFGILDTSVLAY